MILCADIGNTNITVGIFNKKKLILKFEISTSLVNNKRKLASILKKNLDKKKLMRGCLNEAIICSVVPQATKIFKGSFKKIFGIRCIELGKEVRAPIKNRYSVPEKVGQDRLANAVAGIHLYGKPLIIVDFGTCITFDCISAKGQYLGGLIMPGIDMTLDALYEKTALLPKLKMTRPVALIGRNTKESIRSGMYHGFLGGCEFVIKQVKRKLGKKTLVVGTGGYARLFKTKIKSIDIFDLNLTLHGLYLIYREKGRK